MKIGYFCNPTNLGHRRPYADVLHQVRDLAEFCDTHDFDTLWLAEHHFSLWGREVLPNPILMAADLAARTRRLRIGLGAAIITFWHPLRLAEDIGLLDQLCGGRLELGLGRGNYGLEGLNLNPHADPNKPQENYTVFDETLQILKLAFAEPQFSFQGSKYVFPTPGFRQDRAHTVDLPGYVNPETGEMIRISVYPQPLQRPYPPMWQVVDSAGSVEYAARNGLGVIMWRPPLEALKQHFRMHGEVWRDAGHEGRSRTAILRDTFVAESRDQARELAGEHLMKALNWYNWRGPTVYLRPGEELDPSVEAGLREELSFEFVDERRSVLFGTPDDVAEGLIELHREAGVDEVLINSHWSDIPHETSMKSLALFASEVLPRLEAAGLRGPGDSTPRPALAGA